jgi:hypothetical protein
MACRPPAAGRLGSQGVYRRSQEASKNVHINKDRGKKSRQKAKSDRQTSLCFIFWGLFLRAQLPPGLVGHEQNGRGRSAAVLCTAFGYKIRLYFVRAGCDEAGPALIRHGVLVEAEQQSDSAHPLQCQSSFFCVLMVVQP